MELRGVFHEGHTLTFDRVGNNDARLPLKPHRTFESSINRCNIVPIDFDGVPAEGFPLCTDIANRQNLIDGTIKLDLDVIKNCSDVIKAIGGS